MIIIIITGQSKEERGRTEFRHLSFWAEFRHLRLAEWIVSFTTAPHDIFVLLTDGQTPDDSVDRAYA